MPEELVIKYSIGLGLALACLLGSVWARIMLGRQHKLSRKVICHGLIAIFLILCVWVCHEYSSYAIVDFHLTKFFQKAVDIAAPAAIAIIVIHQIFLLIDLIEKQQISKGKERGASRILSRTMKTSIALVVLLLFANKFGLSLSGLLAFGGMGGIIIGLAAKDTLSNFFSGLLLFYDRQFDIGDWICSPDRNIAGTVVEIGWRLTKIMTFDHRPLYVPNALFSTISIENPGRMTNRRIDFTISLRYEDAGRINDVVNDIRAMLAADADIDQKQTTLVYFSKFADSSLDVMIYCFTKTVVWAKWLEVQQGVYLKIIDIVHQRGADFAFNTQTILLSKETPDVSAQ